MKKYTPRRAYKKKKWSKNQAAKLLAKLLTEEIQAEINREIIAKICESALNANIEKDQIQEFLIHG